MLRRVGGLVGLLGVALGLLLLIGLSGLPWWAVAYGVAFWIAMRIRYNRRRSGEDVPAGEDGPRWSNTGRGGF